VQLGETVRSAWRSLLGNGMRTALTALGMIIGVAAVVAVLAVGEGARSSVESRIKSLGSNLLTVRPTSARSGAVRSSSSNTSLTRDDAEALGKVPGVAAVAPEGSGSAQLRSLTDNMNAQVSGVTAPYFGVRAIEVETGLRITELDDRERQRVAVIGSNVAATLFPSSSAVGERIQINSQAFRVIGVIGAKGDMMGTDDKVLVPLSVHQKSLFGQDHVSSINVQVADGEDSASVQAGIANLLRLRHRIGSSQDDDFEVRSQTEMLETMNAVTGTFTALLGSVAAVSLVVGGIGIMNIMLVSVRERTREIGVRIAVGARRRDILLQFLVEAIVVSLAGGIIGVGLGYAAAHLIGRFGGWSTSVPTYAVTLALGVSMAIGLVFGVSPARRASKLDPVEALRTE
jgi:putative ABC transport system permease protein